MQITIKSPMELLKIWKSVGQGIYCILYDHIKSNIPFYVYYAFMGSVIGYIFRHRYLEEYSRLDTLYNGLRRNNIQCEKIMKRGYLLNYYCCLHVYVLAYSSYIIEKHKDVIYYTVIHETIDINLNPVITKRCVHIRDLNNFIEKNLLCSNFSNIKSARKR